MKRLLSFLLLIIFYSSYAQTGEKIAYYYQGKKLSFPVNNGRLVIQLAAGETADKRRAQLSAVLRLPATELRSLAKPQLMTVALPAGSSAATLKQQLVELRNQAGVVFVHPCFTSAYGKDMGYGDELVVKLKPATTPAVLDDLIKQFGCSLVKKYAFTNDTYIVSAGAVNGFDALAVANRFFETGLFVYAEPDLTLFDGLFTNPNDSLYNYQWAHVNTGSPVQYNGVPGTDMKVQQAWAIATGAGIKVAVLDEGVDTGHADLKANLLQGFDCLSGTAGPGDGRPLSPARAHGTNCTGIIAAVANNNIGIAGVAPDCKIIPINLAAANGNFASEVNIAAGFDYAWQNGADIISNSWGGGTPSNVLDDAINRAVTLGRGGKGCVVLFASGNNNAGLSYPATNPNVISVGGVNMCGQRKSPASGACDGEGWGACYGTGLDVVAPCVKIATTDISGDGGYNTLPGAAGDYFLRFNGTSSATPNVAGVVALILSVNNNLTVSQVSNVLENTCDKLPSYSYSMVEGQPNGTWNPETGHGLVNAFNAVQAGLSGIFCNVQIQANGATRFCPGGSVGLAVINPVAGTSYQWRKDGSNFSTGTITTASASGNYDVLATAINGCTAVAAPITVAELTNTPALIANAGIDTFICAGQSVNLGGNPVAANGAPLLASKRVYGMDWFSNSFVKFSLNNPLQFDTVAKNVLSNAEFNTDQFFTGGDFTPYGYYALAQISNKLIKIDTASGVRQLIGIAPAPAGFQWCGMAWDPSTKKLYGLATAVSGSSLCTIDPLTATVTIVAPVAVGSTEWLAVSNSGNMYALSDNDYVYSINKLTGTAAPLPYPVGADVVYQQDADFDPLTDLLYLTTLIHYQNYASDFRTLNTGNGISSVIGSLGGFSEIDATAIAGPSYQYNWSPAAGLSSTTVSVPVAMPLTTTVYTLNVTDMCGNMASSQVTVHVSVPPPVAITAPADSICIGETVRLSATKDNSYAYQWYRNGTIITGATDSFYVAGAGGAYTVRARLSPCDSLSLPFTVKTCALQLNAYSPVALCNSYFYDSGGPDGNYADNESFTRTITASTAGSMPQVTIQSFSTEPGTDVLTIYDGPDLLSPVLATLSGAPAVPLTYTSSSGALTVNFTSNGSVNAAGWQGVIGCYQPNVYRSRASGNAANSTTWEVKSGGVFIDAVTIPHMYDDSIIIQPGHTVIINTGMTLDQLWVMPGATLNIAAPLTLNDGPGNDLKADGILMIGAGGSILGNGNISLTGVLNNTASPASNVWVKTTINGTVPQTIAAGGSFGTVYISNPSVAFSMFNDITIDSVIVNNGTGMVTVTAVNPATQLTINKKISLQNGRVIMGNNAILQLAPSAVTEGGNAGSFVEGRVRNSTLAAGPVSLFFPVGKNVYRPVTLTVTHASAGLSVYQAEVFNTAPVSRTLPNGITGVSSVRHFKISNMGSQPLMAAAATLTYGADDGVTDAALLRMAKDDGSTNWINLGGSGTAEGDGTITSTANFTGFSDFVLANAFGGNNVLPAKWLQVSAKLVGKEVLLSWKIADEVNVNNYTVERSADAFSFTDLKNVYASGGVAAEKQYEATDRLPLKGDNYYRIRRTDKDGKFSYSKTVLVNIAAAGGFILWPSPATETVTVQNSQIIQRLQCYTGNGQLVYDVKPAASQYTLPVAQWAAGIYYVKITSGGKTVQARFVKK